MIDPLQTPTEDQRLHKSHAGSHPDYAAATAAPAGAGHPAIHLHPAVERRLASARPRLVRIARLLGVSADGAEDVAQETLLAAWDGLDSLRDAERFDAWLDGICRNLSRRWLRAHATLAARQQPLAPPVAPALDDPGSEAGLTAELADPRAFDPDEALTRQELVTLLDRALAHLHPTAREPLLLRYIAELPTAAIAARLGISTGAVEVRLHRARRELHDLLGGKLRDEAEAFGLAPDPIAGEGRQPTRIWCPLCGEDRLVAEIDRATGEAHFSCLTCGPRFVPTPANHIVGSFDPVVLAGVSSHKSILLRMLAAVGLRYAKGLVTGRTDCLACGRPARLAPRLPEEAPSEARDIPGLHIRCPVCDIVDVADIWRLTLDHPAAQRFWRAHPRIRVLRELGDVEVNGRPALVSSVVSACGDARLDLAWARDTLDVLAVRGDPPRA